MVRHRRVGESSRVISPFFTTTRWGRRNSGRPRHSGQLIAPIQTPSKRVARVGGGAAATLAGAGRASANFLAASVSALRRAVSVSALMRAASASPAFRRGAFRMRGQVAFEGGDVSTGAHPVPGRRFLACPSAEVGDEAGEVRAGHYRNEEPAAHEAGQRAATPSASRR